jgi:hypothetical protein
MKYFKLPEVIVMYLHVNVYDVFFDTEISNIIAFCRIEICTIPAIEDWGGSRVLVKD